MKLIEIIVSIVVLALFLFVGVSVYRAGQNAIEQETDLYAPPHASTTRARLQSKMDFAQKALAEHQRLKDMVSDICGEDNIRVTWEYVDMTDAKWPTDVKCINYPK